jgi:transcriptional regulator with XRE-family HTH domain
MAVIMAGQTTSQAVSALAEWRADARISQAEAAERVQVSQASWSDWELGRKTPTYENAAQIEIVSEGAVRLEAFGYTPDAAFAIARAPWRLQEDGAPAQAGAR